MNEPNHSAPPRDLSEYQPIPVGEATELPGTFGWLLWDEAVERMDSGRDRPVAVGDWTLEPMEGLA